MRPLLFIVLSGVLLFSCGEKKNENKKMYDTSQSANEPQGKAEQGTGINVGDIAPDIALPAPDGNIVKLSSLRGKYVLIDFWASWCGPCRMENPNVVNVYQAFKDKGFEIYGVSLDRSKEQWTAAIQQDKISWVQVSDLMFWNSIVVPMYGIEGIPHTVLLDKEGRIIAKNLRGPALEAKLQEVIK